MATECTSHDHVAKEMVIGWVKDSLPKKRNRLLFAQTSFNSDESKGKGMADQQERMERIIIQGLRRCMHPLTYRRKGAEQLRFAKEYDVQDLLHSLLRRWVQDVRPEEYTPIYAGKSTCMDFLLLARASPRIAKFLLAWATCVVDSIQL